MNDMNSDTSAAAFDLPTDAAEIEHTVTHPVTGAATPGRITLAGPAHPLRKSAMFARMRRLMADGGAEQVDVEAADEDETAFVATCTLGWSGLSPAGQPRLFAVGAAQTLYSDPSYRWLRDQVRDTLRTRELFISACATA